MSVRSPRPEQTRLNLEPPEGGACPPGEAVALSSNPKPPPAIPPDETPVPLASRRPRRWAHLAWLVVFVVFCLELGFLLILLPWTQFWTSNSLVAGLPWLRPAMENNFVRGAVTGLGVLDLWIGISEAVSYHGPKP